MDQRVISTKERMNTQLRHGGGKTKSRRKEQESKDRAFVRADFRTSRTRRSKNAELVNTPLQATQKTKTKTKTTQDKKSEMNGV